MTASLRVCSRQIETVFRGRISVEFLGWIAKQRDWRVVSAVMDLTVPMQQLVVSDEGLPVSRTRAQGH